MPEKCDGYVYLKADDPYCSVSLHCGLEHDHPGRHAFYWKRGDTNPAGGVMADYHSAEED